MFILIIGLIALVSCLIYFKISYGKFKVATSILLSIYSLLLACLVSITITCITAINCDYVVTDTYETNIVCLKDSTYIYCNRGYSNEQAEYTFMYEVPSKGFIQSRIPADKTYVRYINDNKMPQVITFEEHLKSPILRFITCDLGEKEEYAIFVPEGSIVNYEEYTIDLE